jgi:hypothetical protein
MKRASDDNHYAACLKTKIRNGMVPRGGIYVLLLLNNLAVGESEKRFADFLTVRQYPTLLSTFPLIDDPRISSKADEESRKSYTALVYDR